MIFIAAHHMLTNKNTFTRLTAIILFESGINHMRLIVFSQHFIILRKHEKLNRTAKTRAYRFNEDNHWGIYQWLLARCVLLRKISIWKLYLGYDNMTCNDERGINTTFNNFVLQISTGRTSRVIYMRRIC